MSPIKMTASIDDQDDAMERTIRQISDDVDAVDIGILAGEDATLLIIAAANEFGTRNGHIPERSYIRSAVDINSVQISALAERVWGEIVDGRITKRAGLERMGEEIQRMVQKQIIDVKLPINAPATIARKGSSNPLVDTGRLRASIRWTLARTKDGESGI